MQEVEEEEADAGIAESEAAVVTLLEGCFALFCCGDGGFQRVAYFEGVAIHLCGRSGEGLLVYPVFESDP